MHVRTFRPQKRFNLRFALDTKPDNEISTNSVQNETLISFSLSNSRANLKKALPATPSDLDFGISLRRFYTDNPARQHTLRKSQGNGNLRKARELDAAELRKSAD